MPLSGLETAAPIRCVSGFYPQMTPNQTTRKSLFPVVAFLAALLVCGVMTSPASASKKARFDKSFGNHGRVLTPTKADVLGYQSEDYVGGIGDMALDNKGRIVAGGSAGTGFLVMRYKRNGDVDQSFGNDGRVTVVPYKNATPGGTHSKVTAIAIQPNRKILVFGILQSLDDDGDRPTNLNHSFRLNSNGSIDDDYSGGKRGISLDGTQPTSITLRDNGSFLISGKRGRSGPVNNTKTESVVELRGKNGGIIRSFGIGGSAVFTPEARPHGGIVRSKVLRSGKILAAGYFNNRLFLARLKPNGNLDRSFGSGGTVTRSVVGKCLCAVTAGVKFDRQGRILMAGWAYPGRVKQNQIFLARFRDSGRLDRSFGRKGIVMRTVNPYTEVGDIGIQQDGRILVGAIKGDEHQSTQALFRYLPNGKPDRSFFHNGRLFQRAGSTTNASKILIDDQGRALVGGGTARGEKGFFFFNRFLPGQ